MEHDTMVMRLLEHYEAAGHDEAAGWYRNSRRTARRLARQYGGGLGRAAGIIAALSPQVQWKVNVRMAEDMLRDGWATGQTYANLLKAERILQGERPLTVLGGPKVRAFYRAMMGDEDAAVIDTWMLQAIGWERKGVSLRQYERCAAALRAAAAQTGLTTAGFQAVVWTQVRGGGD
jgi:hypothetical protein